MKASKMGIIGLSIVIIVMIGVAVIVELSNMDLRNRINELTEVETELIATTAMLQEKNLELLDQLIS